MGLSNKEFIELVNEIESEFPINDITYRGVIIWPYIRSVLAYQLINDIEEEPAVPNKSLLRLTINLVKSAVKYCSVKVSALFHKDHVDAFFLTYTSVRLEKTGDRYFSRFADSFQHFMKEYRIKDLEFSYQGADTGQRWNPPVLLDRYYSLVEAHLSAFEIKTRLAFCRKPQITGYRDFLDFINTKNISFMYADERALIQRLEKVLGYEKVFKSILCKYRPKIIFIACYYHDVAFALILACNDLGIKTIEFQHGQQGDYHYMYTHWSKLPKTGYDLLPEYFWMWGEKSAERIRKWADGTSRHRVLVGGNPWLSYCVNESAVHDDWKIDMEQLEELSGKYSRKVLVSLQPIPDYFPGYLVEAIKKSKDIFWLIRLHPKMLDKKEAIGNLLGNSAAYDIEKSTSIPLYTLFKSVDVNITFWSTVAYEALAFGVLSVIVHPNGREAMKEYIEKGIFLYAGNPTDIIDAVRDSVKTGVREDISYIDIDKDLINETFEKLIIV